MKRSVKGVYVERIIYECPAFAKLSPTAIRVYLLFLSRRQFQRVGKKYVCTNDGEIIFTYDDAQKKYGISRSAFAKAINQLVCYRFIRITETGAGYRKMTTLYGFDKGYKLFGTADFTPGKMKKAPYNPGFRKGNTEWMKRGKKSQVFDRNMAKLIPVFHSQHEGIYTVLRTEHGQKTVKRYKVMNGKVLCA